MKKLVDLQSQIDLILESEDERGRGRHPIRNFFLGAAAAAGAMTSGSGSLSDEPKGSDINRPAAHSSDYPPHVLDEEDQELLDEVLDVDAAQQTAHMVTSGAAMAMGGTALLKLIQKVQELTKQGMDAKTIEATVRKNCKTGSCK
jgi:hypothetical protein